MTHELENIVTAAGNEDINGFETAMNQTLMSKIATGIDNLQSDVIADTLNNLGKEE